MDERQFRIMRPDNWRDRDYISVKGVRVIDTIDWRMIEPHEDQADRNHGQTLRMLHSRGGLSACEALAVLEDRPWRKMTLDEAYDKLAEKVRQYQQVERK